MEKAAAVEQGGIGGEIGENLREMMLCSGACKEVAKWVAWKLAVVVPRQTAAQARPGYPVGTCRYEAASG